MPTFTPRFESYFRDARHRCSKQCDQSKLHLMKQCIRPDLIGATFFRCRKSKCRKNPEFILPLLTAPLRV
jgi:hypothetical protein